MRGRALGAARSVPGSGRAARVRRASPGALVFLRGRDADGRLRELESARAAARPVLGEIAIALCDRRAHEALGFRSLGDYAAERLGVGARVVREWARVWRGLRALPELRRAVASGEIGWTVARLVVGLVTPETEAACLETVRGRTVRAVKALVAAVREPGREPEGVDEERLAVRIPCDRRTAGLWSAALELARRVAGERLPVWQCADRIAAEAAAVVGAADREAHGASGGSPGRDRALKSCIESGLREEAFPALPWAARGASVPAELAALAQGLGGCEAAELDRRLRAAVAFLQGLDFETGRILRQVRLRGLHRELGFARFGRYCEERLGLAPRTARGLMALARAEFRAPAVAGAFRRGAIHAFQAHAVLRVADVESARRWVRRAGRVTLRRLEEDVDLEAKSAAVISFRAPAAVRDRFLGMVARVGSLERLLAHAIVTWVREGERFRDRADFGRDGYRCSVPACSARRNLQSHHVWFRSRGGPDVAWNRTTLCAFHHQRAVHGEGTVVIRGRAPEGLVFEFVGLGVRYASGDLLAFS